MKLFQYAVFYAPTPHHKDGVPDDKPVIIKDVTTVLAKDEGTAAMLAARAIPEEYVEKLSDVKVVVRPF